MGIGDLKVPKEMQRIGEAFYGRASAYEAAIASDDIGAIVKALSRNVYGSEGAEPEAAARLGGYMVDALAELSRQDRDSIQKGTIGFPPPM
jgi:cytochrome b pre-mRNA-processing protein 3